MPETLHTCMAILTPDGIQASLNIDLADPNAQALATSLITSVVAYVEAALDYELEKKEATTYFDGVHARVWLPTVAPVSGLAMAAYNLSTNRNDTISSQYVP